MLPEVVLTTDKKKPFNETAFGGFVNDFFGNLANANGSEVNTPPISLTNSTTGWNPDPLPGLPPISKAPKPTKKSSTGLYILGTIVVLAAGYGVYTYTKQSKEQKPLDGVRVEKTPIKTIML